MTVWEFKAGDVNDYAPLVFVSDLDIESGMFNAVGEPLVWKKRPKIEVFVEPKKKPVADISWLTPGSLVLNHNAKALLEPLLAQFGQLLEMDCQGEPRWFYNVTHVVQCIDIKNSTKRRSGALSIERFFPDKVPVRNSVFKDPVTAAGKFYVNEPAKAQLQELIAAAKLLGAEFKLAAEIPAESLIHSHYSP